MQSIVRGKRRFCHTVVAVAWVLTVGCTHSSAFRLEQSTGMPQQQKALSLLCNGQERRFAIRESGTLVAIGDLALACVPDTGICNASQGLAPRTLTVRKGTWVSTRVAPTAASGISRGAICLKRTGEGEDDCGDESRVLDIDIDCSRGSTAFLYRIEKKDPDEEQPSYAWEAPQGSLLLAPSEQSLTLLALHDTELLIAYPKSNDAKRLFLSAGKERTLELSKPQNVSNELPKLQNVSNELPKPQNVSPPAPIMYLCPGGSCEQGKRIEVFLRLGTTKQPGPPQSGSPQNKPTASSKVP